MNFTSCSLVLILSCLLSCVSCWEGYTEDGEYHNTYSKLRDIPRDIPSEAKKVYLYWNSISYIRAGAFSDLSECTELDLRVNQLTKVRADMFEGLYSLEDLDLSYNEITVVLPGTFSALERLQVLYLSHNELTNLAYDVFDSPDYPNAIGGHPSELVLGLDGNPLQCDRDMCWLKEGEAEGWIRFQYELNWVLTCVNYEDVPWKDIDLKC